MDKSANDLFANSEICFHNLLSLTVWIPIVNNFLMHFHFVQNSRCIVPLIIAACSAGEGYSQRSSLFIRSAGPVQLAKGGGDGKYQECLAGTGTIVFSPGPQNFEY
jgi:hypothetical protein